MKRSNNKNINGSYNKQPIVLKPKTPKTPKKPFSQQSVDDKFDKKQNDDIKQLNNKTQNKQVKPSNQLIKQENSKKKQEYSNLHNQKTNNETMKSRKINYDKCLPCIKKIKAEFSYSLLDGNQQNQEVNQLQPLKQCVQDQIAIFLGTPGVGKTFLMKKLFQTEIIEFRQYNLTIDDNLQYNFVDTMGFDFDNDYDEREIQIKHYQDLFYNYPTKIASLLIVVNFERTDLMKKKLLSLYKYFRKFQTQISIIVTDMNLSDDEDKSQIDLQNNFKVFNPHSILFVRRDIEKDELIEKLKKGLIQINTNHYFDLKDTIFEKENEAETKQQLEQLVIRFLK